MSPVHGLQISCGPDRSALTPEQKRFNQLVRQIEQLRRTLAAWHENIPLYAQAHGGVIVPLIKALAAGRREWAFALDRLLDQPKWTRAERAALRQLVCDSAAELLEGMDEADPALKALFDKHSEVDFDTEQEQVRLAMKDMVEAMTGLDLGDATEIESGEDLFRRMQERLATGPKSLGPDGQDAPRRRRRKAAEQQRREKEAAQATQSMREIFRKLASALHPDRETDPARRDAKTALMQKVNQAYGANDLLTLLELQLQIEQVDDRHIAHASAERLRHYNKVLSEQLAELKAEIMRVETGFLIEFGLEPGRGINPTTLARFIDLNSRRLRAALAMHERDMRMLADSVATKRWLKREQRLRDDASDGGYF